MGGYPGPANAASGSNAGGGLVGAVGSPGDRIQLAPLRAHGGSGNVTPPLPLPSGYSRGGGGSTSSSMYGSERGVGDLREVRHIGESLRGGTGKKNPLSIGSIIDAESSR